VEQEKTPRKRAEELIRLLVPDWRPTPRQGLWAIRIGIILGLLVAIGYPYAITLWDWLELLIVPAVIAAGGLWFNNQQQKRQQEDNRRQQERGLAIENQRARDEALEAYLDQMSQLLLDKDKPLRQSQEGDDVRNLARARTLTVLPRLDSERKGSVVRFLYESGLITKDRRVLDLSKADLSEADLWRASLTGANLTGAYLTQAYLNNADLTSANLSGAALYGANLSRANLSNANLSSAWLSHANLSGAKGLTEEQLLVVRSLQGATMPDGQVLKSDNYPDGPTLEDWLKSKGRTEDGENSGPL
jgi:uncharacterized protein YjbI with pentapeptide repeats